MHAAKNKESGNVVSYKITSAQQMQAMHQRLPSDLDDTCYNTVYLPRYKIN